MEKIVEVKNLKKYFWIGGGPFKKKEAVRAIDDINFYIKKEAYLLIIQNILLMSLPIVIGDSENMVLMMLLKKI